MRRQADPTTSLSITIMCGALSWWWHSHVGNVGGLLLQSFRCRGFHATLPNVQAWYQLFFFVLLCIWYCRVLALKRDAWAYSLALVRRWFTDNFPAPPA